MKLSDKLKSKIIRKLGGYTEQMKPPDIKFEHPKIQKICGFKDIPYCKSLGLNEHHKELIKRDIVQRIAEELVDYIKFNKSQCDESIYSEPLIRYSGTIRVVIDEGDPDD